MREGIVMESNTIDESNKFDFRKDAKYTGMVDFCNVNMPIFNWSGCSVQVNFKGTDIDVKLLNINSSKDNWINIFIDKEEPQIINLLPNINTYSIAKGLKNEKHTIEIYKRTEAFTGQIQFLGFGLPKGGKFLPPPPTSLRKIEIIGDSITSAAGNEEVYSEEDMEFKPKYENSYMSYAAISARILSAHLNIISASGSGCYQNYGGEKENTLGDLYLNTNPSESYDKWNIQKWKPDVVVVNLGTNDFSFEIDKNQFMEKYKRLINHIRNKYSEAIIFCAIGPMNLIPGKYINKVVKELNNEGDINIYYLEFEAQNGNEDGLGWGGHPSIKTHEKMAIILAEEIKNKLNW